jgi:hypothetical protein
MGVYTLPGPYPIRLKAGAHLRRVLTYKAGGQAVNLTGWAGKLQVRDAVGAVKHTLSTSPGVGEGTITLGADGAITLDSSTASAVAVGEYRYDLRLTDGAGRKGFLVEGPFEVLEAVTT